MNGDRIGQGALQPLAGGRQIVRLGDAAGGGFDVFLSQHEIFLRRECGAIRRQVGGFIVQYRVGGTG